MVAIAREILRLVFAVLSEVAPYKDDGFEKTLD
jgi:hypothetical protein